MLARTTSVQSPGHQGNLVDFRSGLWVRRFSFSSRPPAATREADYVGLQQLYDKYSKFGFEILDFPTSLGAGRRVPTSTIDDALCTAYRQVRYGENGRQRAAYPPVFQCATPRLLG
jgi:hypothetical protein